MLAGHELNSFFFTKSWCFAGHQRGWHLCGLTLGTPSSWCSLRLQSSLKDIGVLPIKLCQKGAQAVCPAARVLRDDWCPSPLAHPHPFLSMKTRGASGGYPNSLTVGLGLGNSHLCSERGDLHLSLPKPKQVL